MNAAPPGGAFAITHKEPVQGSDGRGGTVAIEMLTIACPCGNTIRKRADAFLPGAHTIICTACGHTGSRITDMGGVLHEIGDAAHRGSAK